MSNLKLKECNLHYKIEGNGPAILFIHGLSDDLNFWKPLTTHLRKNYKTITLDNRGHGQTTYQKGTITIPHLQDDIYQLLKHLKINKITLVGFSMGGIIALNFIKEHPQMVNKLILMSSFSKSDENLQKKFQKIEYHLKKEGLGEFYDTMIPLALPEEVIEEYKDSINYSKSKCLLKDETGIIESINAGLYFDLKKDLKNIKQPTLIIGGCDDELTPECMMEEICNEIPDSKLVFLKNTKHNILIPNNIKEIYKLIDNFLEK
jgi:pimeloyl-ACP methyl ester carboxylesterase